MLRTVTLFIMAVVLSSCDLNLFESRNRPAPMPPPPPPPGIVDTYVPIYAREGTDELKVSTQEVRPTENAGKIFVLGNKLFQVEENAGVHIIDYADKSHPVKRAFLNVPGCKEIALKGNNVYTNNFEDMIVLDLSAYPEVKVKSRIPNVFPEQRHVMPPPRNGTVTYMECVDYSKGRILKWEVKKVNNPNCRY